MSQKHPATIHLQIHDQLRFCFDVNVMPALARCKCSFLKVILGQSLSIIPLLWRNRSFTFRNPLLPVLFDLSPVSLNAQSLGCRLRKQ
eukprot:767888-Hanusia_phi.AAC.5